MVSSAKRAKRKRLAQEAQERESFWPTHQMDPADLLDPVTEKEEEDDQEIRFAPRKQNVEEASPTTARAQATTDCEILNMVSRSITGYGQDTEGVRPTAGGKYC